MSVTRHLVLAALPFLLVLAGCGGGSGPLWEEFDRTYTSLDDRDGFVRSDGFVGIADGGPGVGDVDHIANGMSARMIYCFETSGISSTAEILEATLYVYQEALGGSPYTGHGDLVVDHVDVGPGLDSGDYAGNTRASNIGTLSASAALEWKTLDVRDQVQINVSNGHAYSEFRLRFQTDSDTDGAPDFVMLNDGADTFGSGHVPYLVVRYRAPRL